MFVSLVFLGSLLVRAPIIDHIDEDHCLMSNSNRYMYCDCQGVSSPSFNYTFSADGEMLCIKHPAKNFQDLCICANVVTYPDDIFYNDNDPWLWNDLFYL